jgi:predicted RNase H-like HicB family nuclease
MKLTAVFEPAPEGGFTCFIEEFPGVFSEGETLEEARENLADAFHEVVAWHRDQARTQHAKAIREPLELAAA